MSSKENPEKCTSPALSVTKEEYASPEPHILRALLLEMTPVRSQELITNPQGSSTTIPDRSEPPSIDHWRQLILKVCDNLTSNLGLSATDHLRRSIPDGRYWRTEAEHYADQWKKQQAELSPGAELRKGTLNMGDLRYLIKDKAIGKSRLYFNLTMRPRRQNKAPQELGVKMECRYWTSTADHTRNERAQISPESSSPIRDGKGVPLPYEPSAHHPSEEGEKERTKVVNKQRRKHTAESPIMQSRGKRQRMTSIIIDLSGED